MELQKKEFEKVLNYKNFENYELVEGDIAKTIPNYVKQNPELKMALLHIDVDVYEPTRVILKTCFIKL